MEIIFEKIKDILKKIVPLQRNLHINMDNLKTIIGSYSNHIQSISDCFLKNIATVVGEWEQAFITLSDNNFAELDLSAWALWHQQFLEEEKKHKEDGRNFNIFFLLRDEFGFHIQERMHSKLIKFLLESHASHGQGKKFLIEFLKLLNVELPDEGYWYISAEQGNIDILLYRVDPKSIIIIENKSNWAGDQPNQLYRYWYDAIYRKTGEISKDYYKKNENMFQIIYLAPNLEKQYTPQSISKPKEIGNNFPQEIPIQPKTLCFNDFIQEWLENCKIELNERLRVYLEQYQMLCKTL